MKSFFEFETRLTKTPWVSCFKSLAENTHAGDGQIGERPTRVSLPQPWRVMTSPFGDGATTLNRRFILFLGNYKAPFRIQTHQTGPLRSPWSGRPSKIRF